MFVLRKIIDKYINSRNGRIYACSADFQKALTVFGMMHCY